jgi:cytochrome c peroxidase
MHDGRFAKLMQVINHYTSGIERNRTLHSKLQNPIVLTEVEKVDLITFLLTLSDREFLFNKKFAFPKEVYFETGNK